MKRADMIVALQGFSLRPDDKRDWQRKLRGLPTLPPSMRFRSVEQTFWLRADDDSDDDSTTLLYHIQFSGLVTPRLQKWCEADPEYATRPNKYVDRENGYEHEKAALLLNAAMRIMGPCRFLGEFLRRMTIVPLDSFNSVHTDLTLARMQEILEHEKAKRNMKMFVLESRQAQKLPEVILRMIGSFLVRAR